MPPLSGVALASCILLGPKQMQYRDKYPEVIFEMHSEFSSYFDLGLNTLY